MPLPQIDDVSLCHRTGLHRIEIPRDDGEMLRCQRCFTTDQIGAVESVVRQLDSGKCSAFVDLFGNPRDRGHVLVVPEAELDERSDIRGGMDLDLLCADHGPPALGLRPTHRRLARWIAVSHAVAVWHLEEPIAGGDRSDPDRFEEDVVAMVAHVDLRREVLRRENAWRSESFVGCGVGVGQWRRLVSFFEVNRKE